MTQPTDTTPDSGNETPTDAGGDNLIEPRRSYVSGTLSRDQLDANPITQFEHWLGDARAAALIDATAMVLSTVTPAGHPTSRVVLLKGIDANGFTFYTNHDSSKGLQLQTNPHAALLFYWQKLERQVRIQGTVRQLPASEADDYFYSRPEGSRFSAAASAQSKPVSNRAELESAVNRLKDQYPNGDVPRPDNWGGYLLTPDYLEFWQGRDDRLHDRFIYERQSNRATSTASDSEQLSWSMQRLSP